MDITGLVSSHLITAKEKVLFLWEERCLKEVASAGPTASLALRDSVPIYLDHLIQALAANRRLDFNSVFLHDEEARRIGKLHGADRASNSSYILTEVIFEYHILREVIFQVLEADGPLPALQRDIIYDSIEQAVNDAAVQFSEVHADIQQKFINTLTHDLKTPLTAAKTNAELILRRPEINEYGKTSARRIVVSLNRLDGMIHDLLDASRIRAGEKLSLQFVSCDLGEILHEVIDEMMIVHGDRFRLKVEGTSQGTWGGDGIRRACENLIGNAVKYGAPDTPILVSLKATDSGMELGVHNQGTPILSDEIPTLFQQHRRSKSAGEGNRSGWGLGLTLVKGVVDAHKGKVRIESREGFGTVFTLEIPYPECGADSVAAEAICALTRGQGDHGKDSSASASH